MSSAGGAGAAGDDLAAVGDVALMVPVPVRAPPLMLIEPPSMVPPLRTVEPAVWVYVGTDSEVRGPTITVPAFVDVPRPSPPPWTSTEPSLTVLAAPIPRYPLPLTVIEPLFVNEEVPSVSLMLKPVLRSAVMVPWLVIEAPLLRKYDPPFDVKLVLPERTRTVPLMKAELSAVKMLPS